MGISKEILRSSGRSVALLLCLLAAGAMMASVPSGLEGVDKPQKPLRLKGIVTQVEPTRLTIRDGKGNDVAVQPKEDFTEKVAVGSQVTAWYYPAQPVNELQWLEYPLEVFFVSPKQFLGPIKKIILLPSSAAGDADGLYDAVEGFLQNRMGWFVAHRMLAEEIERRSQKPTSTLDAIDAATGEVDLSRYATPRRQLMQRIADAAHVDAVLETDIELVQVNFHSQVAVWDGSQQLVSSKVSRTVTMLASIPIDGHVPASTALFKLWDAQGRLLWIQRRGFCVLALEQGIGLKFRERPIAEAVQDSASVEKWLNRVFGSWLPAESGPSAGLSKQ